MCVYIYTHTHTYTEQNYKRNTFVFAPIFHELNSKIQDFFYVHKAYLSQILFPNLFKSVLMSTSHVPYAKFTLRDFSPDKSPKNARHRRQIGARSR